MEKGSRILVTGAAGFVGRRLVASLVEAGYVVRAMTHSGRNSQEGRQGVEAVRGDVTDPESLRHAMEGVRGVVHLVAIIREDPPKVTFEHINVEGTRNVVRAAREAHVQHFVHQSALGAVDNVHLGYNRAKWLSELEVRESGIPFTILRPALLFGEGDEFMVTLAGLVRASPVVPVPGDGKTMFQPLSVDDCVRCLTLSLQHPQHIHQTYEIGGPERLSYNDIIRLIASVLGAKRALAHVPLAVMRPQVRLMEMLLPRPPATSEQLKNLGIDNVTDVESVQNYFGFRPLAPSNDLEYLRKVTRKDGITISLGRMPKHLRDH